MLLRSDNVAGVSPEIMRAIAAVAEGDMLAYGDDPLTRSLPDRFGTLFGRRCTAVPVGTGIVANALALSLAAGPLDAAVASAEAHAAVSEGGAFEMFSAGAKLLGLESADGKLHAEALDDMLAHVDFPRAATVPPQIVSITQATERGLVYRLEEIAAIAAVVRRHGLKLHMDGARFANAVVSLGCTAADLVAHVDVLSFGATKNGAMMAEALVVFDESLTARMAQRIRRAGQCASKQRFMAAQLIAYLEDDLWLRNARAANAAARQLAQGLSTLPGVALAWPVEANLVFATIAPEAQARLAMQDIAFRPRDSKRPEDNLFRLVPSFATTPAAIETLLDRCRRALG